MALSLSRGKRQSLLIGDNITVTVANVCGGRVTLQVEAPKDVPILRKELTQPFYRRKSFLKRIIQYLRRYCAGASWPLEGR